MCTCACVCTCAKRNGMCMLICLAQMMLMVNGGVCMCKSACLYLYITMVSAFLCLPHFHSLSLLCLFKWPKMIPSGCL